MYMNGLMLISRWIFRRCALTTATISAAGALLPTLCGHRGITQGAGARRAKTQ